MRIQNNLSDVFQLIAQVYDVFRIYSSFDYQGRCNITQQACMHLVHYLHHKSKYQKQLVPINNELIFYENKILQAFGNDITRAISDEAYAVIKDNTGNIQKLLLNVMPPESEGFKSLMKIFPDLLKYKPN